MENNETKRVKTADLNRKAKKKVKTKKTSKFKQNHPKLAKGIKIGILVFLLILIIGSGVLVGTFLGFFGDELKIEEESLVVGYENATVYDADGNLIATLSDGAKRKSISLSEMSEYLPKAFVAIEDERFYSHSGFDIKRTAAATFTYIINGGKSKFGGSTITQQVIKNITKEKDNTALAGVVRKVKEISKSMQVEQYLSKDQILELYLNLIFMGGDDINGVELGSIYYFNKSAKDLSIAECAYLAGINHSPNGYKPFKDFSDEEDPEAAKAEMTEKINNRTKTVLGKMLEVAYITQEQYDAATKEVDEGLKFEKGESSNVTVDLSYHTEAALAQVLEQIMSENEDMSKDLAEMTLYSGGLKIYTTQKTDIQNVLEEVIVDDAYFTEITTKKKDKETGEEIKKTQYSIPTMVIQDHKTGYVVAAATATGEEDSRTAKTKLGYFNYPIKIKKQTGSSMKPISVIAPGLETGVINAATVYIDQPTVWGTGPEPYDPGNYDGYPRMFVTMRNAIEVSANIPHVKALTNIGTEAAVAFCQSVGLPEFTEEGLSLALGGLQNGVSPADMAGAYAAIANDGVYKTPIYYTSVTDLEGNILYEPEQEERVVMTEQNAYILQNILTQPVISGTATYCKISNMDVAAKTGTTNDELDRWLCGFTEYYTAACWYGYEENAEVKYSGNPAGKIWDAVMTKIHEGLEEARFEEPEGIIRKTVCRTSGKIATEVCGANVYTEVFTEDNQPEGLCEGHSNLRICNDTQLLATDFCPNVTEQYVYLPEKERDAIWVTTGVNTAIPEAPCTMHVAPPAPPPTIPETNTSTSEITNTIKNTVTNGSNKENTVKHSSHKYSILVSEVKATCTKEGSKVMKCSCGETKTEKIEKVAHKYGKWTTTKQPTITEEGVQTRTCSVCTKAETQKIDKLKEEPHTHSYTEKVSETEATCTAAVTKTMKCSCGDTTTITEGSPLPHTYTWTVTTPATETADGIETGTCSCGDTTTRSIPKITEVLPEV